MRGLFQAIRPFLSQSTRQKIQMASDRYVWVRVPELRDTIYVLENSHTHLFLVFYCGASRSKILADFGPESQDLTEAVNLDHYLKEVPFYCPYNSCEDSTIYSTQ
jgi:hypothetical protein